MEHFGAWSIEPVAKFRNYLCTTIWLMTRFKSLIVTISLFERAQHKSVHLDSRAACNCNRPGTMLKSYIAKWPLPNAYSRVSKVCITTHTEGSFDHAFIGKCIICRRSKVVSENQSLARKRLGISILICNFFVEYNTLSWYTLLRFLKSMYIIRKKKLSSSYSNRVIIFRSYRICNNSTEITLC